MFIFKRINYLHDSKFNQLDILWDFIIFNLKGNKDSPQFSDGVDIKRFLHCQLNIVCHVIHNIDL